MKSIFDNIFNNYDDLDTNDPKEVTKFQEYAVKKGLINSADIAGAGRGKFGPKTQSAYNQLYGNKSTTTFQKNQELYKEGNSGMPGVIFNLAKHIFLPPETNLTVGRKTQKQMAAIISNQMDNGRKSKGSIEYRDHEKLAGLREDNNPSGDVAKGNSSTYIIGSAKWEKDPNTGNIIVNDTYNTDVLGNVVKDKNGNISVIITKRPINERNQNHFEGFSSWKNAFEGLVNDIFVDKMLNAKTWSENRDSNPNNDKDIWDRLHRVSENFIYRQGKSRPSGFVIPKERFNKWTGK